MKRMQMDPNNKSGAKTLPRNVFCAVCLDLVNKAMDV